MRNAFFIADRELGAFLRTPFGYVVIAATLVVNGLLFNAFAIGTTQKLSTQVVEDFFFFASGTTLFAAIFISMRLIAEERQSGTMTLIATSPVRNYELVLGKYISAMILLGILMLSTLYMPLLIMLNGKVALGHIAAGYLGLALLGSAAIGLGLLSSAMAPNQVVAAVLSAVLIATFVLLWLLSRIADPPLNHVLAYMALHDKHFLPFMRGIVSLRDVVFYLSLTYVALVGATRAVEARRWR
ncbi:ABC transporter permease subunit [Myxococcota bacterium]|nr:ABC transporter permease subunit [Myxococcota bacterium]